VKHRDELNAILIQKLRLYKNKELAEKLKGAKVSCGEVNNMQDVFNSAEIRSLNMRTHCQHPITGNMEFIGTPLSFYQTSQNRDTCRLPPPRLGEQTEEILATLGYNQTQILSFRETGVV